MNEAETPTARPAAADKPSVRQSLQRITLEILVGFVGVYAAFALSAYKDQRDLTERRHQIKRALIAEIRPITDLARKNAPFWYTFSRRFDSTAALGHPVSRSFIETVNLPANVWEATKAAGGLGVIDVPTFVLLSDFYNSEAQELAQYQQLRDFYIREIIPRITAGPSSFYVPGTKQLLPVFGIYRYALRRLSGFDSTTARLGDSLIVQLARDTI